MKVFSSILSIGILVLIPTKVDPPPGDKAFLKLHKGYKVPSQENRKLSNQRCGSFLMKKRVERLSYELNLSLT